MNNPQFRKAVKEGDTKAISAGARAGFTANYRFAKGQTPLHVATVAGNAATVEFLISQGADVNGENDAWETPLELAEKLEAKDVKAVLLRHAAKRSPESSLHSACFRGRVKHVRAHLDAGAGANATRHGELPICIALRGNHVQIAQLLLPKIQPAATEASGTTPLHAAAAAGINLDLLQALIKHGIDINTQNNWGETALTYAARHGNQKAVKLLAQSGADLDLDDPKNGHSAVSAALSAEEWDTARLLIDLGAEVDIHEATKANHPDKVRQLIESGVDVDTSNCVGHSALHIAVERGLHELAEFVLKSGASPNLREPGWPSQHLGGGTPLHAAVEKADIRMIRLLMAYKADPEIRDLRDFSPLDIATGRNQPHIIRLLSATPPQQLSQQPVPSSPPIGQLYTIEAVAQLLSVDTNFVLSLIKEKKLKTIQLGPDILRISIDSLASYLAGLSQA